MDHSLSFKLSALTISLFIIGVGSSVPAAALQAGSASAAPHSDSLQKLLTNPNGFILERAFSMHVAINFDRTATIYPVREQSNTPYYRFLSATWPTTSSNPVLLIGDANALCEHFGFGKRNGIRVRERWSFDFHEHETVSALQLTESGTGAELIQSPTTVAVDIRTIKVGNWFKFAQEFPSAVTCRLTGTNLPAGLKPLDRDPKVLAAVRATGGTPIDSPVGIKAVRRDNGDGTATVLGIQGHAYDTPIAPAVYDLGGLAFVTGTSDELCFMFGFGNRVGVSVEEGTYTHIPMSNFPYSVVSAGRRGYPADDKPKAGTIKFAKTFTCRTKKK